MKATLSAFYILSTIFFLDFALAENQPQVIGEVNNHKFYSSDIDQIIKNAQGLALDSIDSTQINQVKKQILNKMIDRRILLDVATQQKFSPSEDMVLEKINSIKQRAGSPEEYSQLLTKNNLSEQQLMVGLKEDLAITQYLDDRVFKNITVSEKEIENYYQNNKSSLKAPKELHLKQILVKATSDEASRLNAKNQIINILAQANSDPFSFSDLAQKYSEGPERFRGGDIGFVTLNQLDQSFGEAIFNLKTGQISEVTESKYGFHIFKVEEERGGMAPLFSEIKAQLREKLINEKKLKALEQHLVNLRQKQQVIIYLQ